MNYSKRFRIYQLIKAWSSLADENFVFIFSKADFMEILSYLRQMIKYKYMYMYVEAGHLQSIPRLHIVASSQRNECVQSLLFAGHFLNDQ